MPEPLGQVDAKILECLERVDGLYPILLEHLLTQLNERELADMPIGHYGLRDRLQDLVQAGLVERSATSLTYKLAPTEPEPDGAA